LLLDAGKEYPEILEHKKGIMSLDMAYFTSRYPDSIAGDMIPADYYEEEDGCECIRQAENILQKIRIILI
jgi:HEPN domain-containing protein